MAIELALILVAINLIWKRSIPQNKKILFISKILLKNLEIRKFISIFAS